MAASSSSSMCPISCSYNSALNFLVPLMREGKVSAEKVRADALSMWTTVGVVSALILTMLKFGDVAEQKNSDPWLDCKKVSCNDIHVVFVSIALIASTYTLVSSTVAFLFMSVTPSERTADFFESFPHAWSSSCWMMVCGVIFWVCDTIWLAMLTHGCKHLLPAVAGFVLIWIWMFSVFRRMRKFVWSDPQIKQLATPFEYNEV
eukprot:TRINITY_DN94117_c0_g1_i1.p1 TRINITY_DN94117_c0_g1~~TRINITY_DN94117_c0_g1_i1.p1  ORF type:complete len:204 (+),score=11.97 TRINITY_DN94117_c0_g1_i1:71-682(+)